MIVKAATLFLVFIAVLAMFGKLSLLFPRSVRGSKCPNCGRYRIGKGPCECGKG